MARLDPRRAKIHRTYSVEDMVRLFGVHPNTVRRWLIQDGLQAIDDRRPTLVHGAALAAFLSARRSAGKRPTPPGMFYCFGCRDSRPPALGMADFTPPNGTGAGNLRALCEICGTVMNRRARQGALEGILPGIEVRVMEAEPRIAERQHLSLNCALKKVDRP